MPSLKRQNKASITNDWRQQLAGNLNSRCGLQTKVSKCALEHTITGTLATIHQETIEMVHPKQSAQGAMTNHDTKRHRGGSQENMTNGPNEMYSAHRHRWEHKNRECKHHVNDNK